MQLDPSTAHEFIAPLIKSEIGFLKQHYTPVPTEIADAILATGSRRVIVVLRGKTLRRAIQNTKDGMYFIFFGVSILKEMKIAPGDELVMALHPDPDPDFVELGEEFEEVLAMDEERWPCNCKATTIKVGSRAQLFQVVPAVVLKTTTCPS